MANETLARRYADAIYQLALENQSVERIGADLRTAYVHPRAASRCIARCEPSPNA